MEQTLQLEVPRLLECLIRATNALIVRDHTMDD